MNKPVLQILAAMLLHQVFREAMIANPASAAAAYGYTLTPAELRVVLKIVKSFDDQKMDDAIENLRRECPNWPCDDGSLEA